LLAASSRTRHEVDEATDHVIIEGEKVRTVRGSYEVMLIRKYKAIIDHIAR